jgi:hypothetical protein
MHFERAKIDVLLWITGFVERPNAQLDGWPPCPYARKARLDGQFDIRQGGEDVVKDLCNIDLGELMVIAYIYERDLFTAAEFNQAVRQLNQDYLLKRNLIALADHPDDVETVKGVIMNQGTWPIVFVQPLDKLNHFAKLIAGKGYYDGWPEEYLEGLFEGREDPRT